MPFCPRCKYEYNSEVSRCPDCDCVLVDEIVENPETLAEQTLAEAGWEAIGVLTSSVYAEQLVEGLRNAGIPAEVISGSGYFGQMGMMGDSSYSPAGAGYLIMVAAERYVEADELAEVILGEIWVKSRTSRDR